MMDTSNNVYDRYWRAIECQPERRQQFIDELVATFDSLSEIDRALAGYTLVTGKFIEQFRPISMPYEWELPTYHGSQYPIYRDAAVESAKQLILHYLSHPEPDNGRFVADMANIITSLNKKALSGFWAQVFACWSDEMDGGYEGVAKVESLVILADTVIKTGFRDELFVEHIDSLVGFAIRQGDAAKTCRSQFNAMGYSELLSPAFGLKAHFVRKGDNRESVKIVYAEAMKAYSELIAEERAKGGHYLELAIRHSDAAMQWAKGADNKSELAKLKQAKDEMQSELMDYRTSGKDPFTAIRHSAYEIPAVFPEQPGISEFRDIINALYKAIFQSITRDKIRERINDNSLLNVFGRTMSSEDGVVVFNALVPVEDCAKCDARDACKSSGCRCYKSREAYNLSTALEYWAATCHGIISALKELDDIDVVVDAAMSDKAPNPDRIHTILFGIEQWLQGYHYTALRLICPEFEYLLRKHIERQGGLASDTSVRIDRVNTLRGVLQKNKEIDWAPSDIKWFIEVLLTAEPLNLRNKPVRGLIS